MNDTTDPQAAVEERVARHLAAKDWLTTSDRWDRGSASFRADYLAYAREVIALVQAPDAAVPSAPADQAALRDRIAEALTGAYLTAPADSAIMDVLADVVLSVLPAPADRAAEAVLQRVRKHLEARLDTVAVDPAEVYNLLAEVPLSPFYEHPDCGFHWHGRDGMDIPIRDGEPVCPRCELRAVEKRLAHVERRRAEVGEESRRRGKTVLEHSERIRALEREIDGIQRQLGAEILRANEAEAELRRMADEAQQPAGACPDCGHLSCDGYGPCGAITKVNVDTEGRCACIRRAADEAQQPKEA